MGSVHINHYAIPISNTTFSVDVMESWSEEEPPDLSQFLAVYLEEGGGAVKTLPPSTQEDEATDSGLVVVGGNTQCPICFKEFTRRRRMLVHLRTHTGERPHECDICLKRFTRSDKLVAHKRTHTGERPYHCFCGKRFTRVDHLKTHSTTHGSTPKFIPTVVVPESNKKSVSSTPEVMPTVVEPESNKMSVSSTPEVMPTVVVPESNKKIVRSRRLSERKILICSYCDQKFTQSYKYTRHVRTHTGEKPYHCMCGAHYSRSDRLRKHLLENPEHVQVSSTSFGEDLADCVANISTLISTDTPALPDCLNGDDNDCDNKRQSTGVTNEMEMYAQPITTSPSDTKKYDIQEDNRVIDSLMQNVTQQEDIRMDTTQQDDAQGNETQQDYVQRDEAQEYETWEDGSQQDDVQREETQQDNTQRDETEQINTQKDGFLMADNKVKDMQPTGDLVMVGNTQCPVCFKEFTRRRRMLVHLRTHTGERPHECDICLKRFSRSDKLVAHKRTHTGERPYHCFCGKRFTRVDHLKTHLTTHGLTPKFMPTVVVPESNKKSVSSTPEVMPTVVEPESNKMSVSSTPEVMPTVVEPESNKKIVSSRRLSERKILICSYCDQKFTQSYKYTRHVRTHTGEKPYHCMCGAHYSRSDRLRKHLLENPEHVQVSSTSFGEDLADCVANISTLISTDTPALPDCLNGDDNDCDNKRQSTGVTNEMEMYAQPITTSPSDTKKYDIQKDNRVIDSLMQNVTQQEDIHMDTTQQDDAQDDETRGNGTQHHHTQTDRTQQTNVHRDETKQFDVQREEIPQDSSRGDNIQKNVNRVKGVEKTGDLLMVGKTQCPICFKEFTRRRRMLVHLRTHTGERPHECDICLKRFTRSDKLVAHKRTHTGERPYHCFCGKRFTRVDHLKTHSTTHGSTPKFIPTVVVPESNKKSVSSTPEVMPTVVEPESNKMSVSLTPEVMPTVVVPESNKKIVSSRRLSERKILICSYCDQKFTQSYKYTRHVRTHTGEKPYHCMCGAHYSRSDRLRKHLLENPEHVQESSPSQTPKDTPISSQVPVLLDMDILNDTHIFNHLLTPRPVPECAINLTSSDKEMTNV
ncbi:hypothetical protein Pcinc_003641 [Petrolisthes cinctipes]|uniref:C2H2-type domain-containing protein n=1 Tax=Petrolisthes cinctipes TaxID=88211 RepID=A0AAE1GIM9_PETCI|nr:hypothetical protein Pcinc_003641 [Petrolisthes cinctipes]